MDHEEAKELIQLYADGELDALHAGRVEAHLQECATCRSTETGIQALRAALRKEAPAYRAPARLRRNIRAVVRREDRSVGSGWPAWLIPAAAFACAVVLLAAVWSQTSHSTGNALADEVIGNHVRSLLAVHLVDVASSDQHTVKPWFNGKVDFAPQVRDFNEQGFSLAGGRLDYLNRRTAVALVYRRDEHPINVFILPSVGNSDRPAVALSRRGYNLVRWTANGMDYWGVSDVNGDDLRRLAALIAS